MSDRYGTDRLAGPIFNRKDAPANGEAVEMDVFAHGFAAGEAEFLLRIGATPPAGKSDYSLDEAADLIEAVHVGIEVASSPLGTINELGPIAVISDFGNNNGLVIGPEIPGLAAERIRDLDGRDADRRRSGRHRPRRRLSRRRDRRGALPVRADGAARHQAGAGPVDFVRRGYRGPCGAPASAWKRGSATAVVRCTLAAAQPE